jgi:hypothetical protein
MFGVLKINTYFLTNMHVLNQSSGFVFMQYLHMGVNENDLNLVHGDKLKTVSQSAMLTSPQIGLQKETKA